jgi:alpha-amylase
MTMPANDVIRRRRRACAPALPIAALAALAALAAGACAGAPADDPATPADGGANEAPATAQGGGSEAVLFQGFHWNSARAGNWYDKLAAKADDLRDLGVTHVWFPPPSDSGAAEGYMPRRLNVLDSSYGTEAQLRRAIEGLRARGIASVADVVVNHRVGTADWADFTDPAWGCEAVAASDEWTGKCGGNDSGDGFGAARDLDHAKPAVQEGIKAWLTGRLKAVGFDGIRFDYVRGYAPAFAKAYHDAWNPGFCVGELWTDLDYNNVDAHRQALVNWVDGTAGACAAFDFTTKGLLNHVLGSREYGRLRDGAGKPAGGIGLWADKQVTFVDNHDTGPSEACGNGQSHWAAPCDKVLQGYAYVLTHPGVPSIYYPHVYDWNLRGGIKALVDARKGARVNSSSAVTIDRAENGLYAAFVQGKAGQLAVKLGPAPWSPGAGWTLATSGDDFAVWTKRGGG